MKTYRYKLSTGHEGFVYDITKKEFQEVLLEGIKIIEWERIFNEETMQLEAKRKMDVKNIPKSHLKFMKGIYEKLIKEKRR